MKIHGLEFEKASAGKDKNQVKSSHPEQGRRGHSRNKFGTGSELSRHPELVSGSTNMKASNLVLIGVIIILGGALGWVLLADKISLPWSGENLLSPVSEKKSETKKSKYQAVFLTNGQVYFGKLSGYPKGNPLLKDVYYLRAQRALQPPADTSEKEVAVEDEKKTSKKEKEKETEPAAAEKPELTLIKLGNELHGPVDEIKLNKEHILFVEDLRESSRIVLAIEKFQQQL